MKRLSSYGLALLVAGYLALSSCKDDLSMDTGLSDRISFAVENTTGGDESYVRSGFYYSYPPESVMELQPLVSEDADSLLLSVTESAEFVSNDRWNAGTFVTTRGSLATLSSSTEFGVSASVYPSSGSYSSYGLGNYFHNMKCTPNTALEYYWPSPSNKISFYAYYPYGNSYFTMSSDAMANGYPVYSYSVPSDIAKQVDVMTASVVDNACIIPHGPVTLQFKHNCASVRFKFNNTGADPITIKSISLEGLKYSGTLQNGTWTLNSSLNSSSANPFSLTLNTAVSAGATADLTGTENIFIMLPQTLSGSSVLKIVTAEKTYSTVLSGEWLAGKTYTYTVKMDESWSYYLDVSGTADFAYSGGTNNYTVKSYKQSVGGTQQAVAWTASFSTDGGSTWSSTAPSWLTAFTATGSGGTSASSYSATVTAQSATTTKTSATSILRSMPAVSDYDLSTEGGTKARTTANCYMVHAPGTYKLPLVYGNAIKDGATNDVAYLSYGTNSYCLKNFLNTYDQKITDPWIKNNTTNGSTKISVKSAKLWWMDAPSVISSVGISGDYLTFTVSSANIAECNAVISALHSDGTVAWTWHIWITPQDYSNLTTIGDDKVWKVTPVNLGWVGLSDISVQTYSQRTCLVKVTQSGSNGLSKQFKIDQAYWRKLGYSKIGYCPFYQFGRPIPESPGNGVSNGVSHSLYNLSGSTEGTVNGGAGTTIGYGLRSVNLHLHYDGKNSLNYPSNGWENFGYANFWCTNSTFDYSHISTRTTEKSVYDPCPPEFFVPPGGCWNYICNKYSSSWDSSNYGRMLGDLWFPASGLKYHDNGYLHEILTGIWVATNSSEWFNSQVYLLSYEGTTPNVAHSSRSHGIPVRPVTE